MQRFADCCRQIHDQLASCTVRGITVTTFGVDGALVDEQAPCCIRSSAGNARAPRR